jgi:tetratricopeptide (TPR) repeat protein
LLTLTKTQADNLLTFQKFRMRLLDAWWVAVLTAALLLLACREVTDLDLFYHLANGESILAAGEIPSANPFTFTRSELPYYPNPSWLFGVLVALIHHCCGVSGIVIGKAALLLLLFGVLLRYLCREGVAVRVAGALLWLVAMACAFRFTERPHLFSHLLLGALLLLVQRRDGLRRLLPWLIALFALWANLHAGFILGLAYLATLLAGEWLDGRLGQRSHLFPGPGLERSGRRALLAGAVAAAAATLLTPNPLAPYRMALASFGVVEGMPITEYAPSTLAAHPWFFALTAVIFAALLLPPHRIAFARLLPAFFFLAVALASQRFIPDFAIAAMPLAAERLRQLPALRTVGGTWRERLARGSLVVLPGVMLLVVLLAPPVGSKPGLGVDRRELPSGALHFLAQPGLRGNLYNSMGFAGIGMQYLYPRYRLYQTSYLQVERDRIDEAFTANRTPQQWQSFLDKYRIDVAFVDITREQHSPLYYPSELWALVYFDDLSAVFLRRGAGNDDIIRREEIGHVHPARFFESSPGGGGIDRLHLEEGIAELRRLLAWDQDSYIGHLMLGFYLNQAQGKAQEALLHFSRAAQLHPASAVAHFQRGILLRDAGELDPALASLRRAARLQPDDALAWNELGVTLGMKGELKKAVAAFTRALEIEPGNTAARQNLAHARQLQVEGRE